MTATGPAAPGTSPPAGGGAAAGPSAGTPARPVVTVPPRGGPRTFDPDEQTLQDATELVLEAMEDSPDATPATADERHRVRQVLGSMVSRMTAERAIRAAETAADAGRRAAAAAAEVVAEEKAENRRVVYPPFRTGFLAGLGVLLAYVTFLSLDSIQATLILIAVAALLAVGLDPAVRFFIRRGFRRGWAVTIVFLLTLASLGAAFYAIIPPIVQQVSKFVQSAPQLLADLLENPTIKGLDQKFGIIKQLQQSSFIQNLGGGAVSVGVTVAGVAVDLVIVLILALYFLGGLPRITATAYRLAPASRRPRVTDLGNKIILQMGGYLSGAVLISLQAGLIAGGFAWIAGLPYPWAIALGASVLDFVPVVGPVMVGISIMLIGFTQSLTIGIVAGAFYLVQHLFEAYWLYPRVMRRTVDISAAAVVVAILLGAALLGVTGALLAVPVAAAVQLIVREVVMPMQERN